MRKVDVVVIGSGSAGMTVAYTGKGWGKSVLMIDQRKPGGECTWSGCIPSKALISQANDLFTAKKFADFEVDTAKVMEAVRAVILNVYEGESIEVLKKDGIDFLQGHASFDANGTLSVGDEVIQAKHTFICTGSSPFVPPIKGLETTPYLTNETIFELESLPDSMIVLGAGAIGVELSQAMNRIGVQVTLVEMADRILPREDAEFSELLREKLADEGVRIVTSGKAIEASTAGNEVHLTVETTGGVETITGNQLLLALGRKANTEGMGLEEAGIDFDRRGIKVNDHMRTSLKGVYAVGDVVGPYQFSHMANYQGIQAANNAFLPINRRISYDHKVWTTFTQPELATAGMTEAEAREKYGDRIRVYRQDFSHLDRAKTKPGDQGMVKLILSPGGKVLGCSILADRAGEMISEIQVIKTLGINFGSLFKVIHPYPTYGEIFQKLGKKVAVDNIFNHPIVKLFRK